MTADTGRRSVTRPDGRVIEFLVAGPADGLPLVLHEGTPCGLVLYRSWTTSARAASSPRAGPAAARTRWPAPPSCPAELTAFLERAAGDIRQVTGEQVAQAFGGLVIEADQAVLTGAYADHVAACLRNALSSGIAGWRDDDLAFIRDWGFALDPGITGAPPLRAAIWQGDQDRMVPFGHGQWLAAHIPGARVHLMPGDGHLSMTVSAFDRILDDLLDLAGLAA